MKVRLFKKGNAWYFIGPRFQGAHPCLKRLLREAKAKGEMPPKAELSNY